MTAEREGPPAAVPDGEGPPYGADAPGEQRSPRRPRRPMDWPAFVRTARRPRWIAALVIALAIAGGFAALGQWQLSRGVQSALVAEVDTETSVRLAEIAEPRTGVTDGAAGRLVTVEGDLVPDDFVVLTDRREDGEVRAWLVGRILTADGVSLAVALGSADNAEAAARSEGAALELGTEWRGRYLPTESPQQSDFEARERNALAVAELANEWQDFDGQVYGGYLVAAEPPAGLDAIAAPPPEQAVVLNWLNVFYAVEWALFAGFALYLWYRLVRDAVERGDEPLN